MYTDPEIRSSGVGAALIDAAKDYGRARGWERIDVTAPESDGWERTRQFYERNGFAFTGPKLKFVLNNFRGRASAPYHREAPPHFR